MLGLKSSLFIGVGLIRGLVKSFLR